MQEEMTKILYFLQKSKKIIKNGDKNRDKTGGSAGRAALRGKGAARRINMNENVEKIFSEAGYIAENLKNIRDLPRIYEISEGLTNVWVYISSQSLK